MCLRWRKVCPTTDTDVAIKSTFNRLSRSSVNVNEVLLTFLKIISWFLRYGSIETVSGDDTNVFLHLLIVPFLLPWLLLLPSVVSDSLITNCHGRQSILFVIIAIILSVGGNLFPSWALSFNGDIAIGVTPRFHHSFRYQNSRLFSSRLGRSLPPGTITWSLPLLFLHSYTFQQPISLAR